LQRYAVLLTTLIDEAEAGMTEAARALWRQRLLQVRWPFIRQELTALISETRQGAEHVKDVVGDLKTLARSSTVPEQVNPDVCVRSALTVLSHQLKHRTVVTPRLACTESVRMVRSQVTQLLINLVHNALESLPAQGGEIRIATHQGPGGTTISVEDNGPGIPAAVRERIFEPFYTTKEHGTGLGLAIAQQIAQAHAGRLECDSSPELRGARFILRFSGMPASGPLPVATA
jgi:signal transduction histidine kinase